MEKRLIGELKSSPVIKRCPANPILTAANVPAPASLIFNAGIVKYQGRYVMLFRNDCFHPETRAFQCIRLGMAYSKDGIAWEVQKNLQAIEKPLMEAAARHYLYRDVSKELLRAYDPRLTVIDGRVIICFALDTLHGLRGGIATTEDFEHFDVTCLTTPDNRNMVVFPERVGGKYIRLERPMPVYSHGRDKFDIWLSSSSDLRSWGEPALVLGMEEVPFANDKLGPAAPPVRTSKGWLTTFHAVDRDDLRGKNGWEAKWQKRYTAGIMLLDLNDPRKVIGFHKEPLLAPEAPYEIADGYRNHVIFPGGMILEDNGEVKIYYGAADTVECLATAHVDDLLDLCLNKSQRSHERS
ncbi:MAG: glycosidase [Lentisphaerae bacterium GWF2_52_8]|nr:MAG: glycosidase [Lentisphaerae bacterium GWF2_52_8]